MDRDTFAEDASTKVFQTKNQRFIGFLQGESGFSLIDTIIGLTLIAVVIATLLMSLSTSIRASDRNRDNAFLLQLARSQLEDILKQPYSDSHSYSTISPIPDGYTLDVGVTVPITYTYSSPGSGYASETLQYITVTASGDWTSLSLSGFKVR